MHCMYTQILEATSTSLSHTHFHVQLTTCMHVSLVLQIEGCGLQSCYMTSEAVEDWSS